MNRIWFQEFGGILWRGEGTNWYIEFTEEKVDLENDENVIAFRWSDVQGEDEPDIAKENLIESLQKQYDEEFLPKK